MYKQPSTLKQLGSYVSRVRKRWKRESSDKPAPTYRRNSFNEFGDHVAHYYAPATFRKEGSFTEIKMESFDMAVREVNRFKRVCDNQGVTTLFSHPPVSRDCLTSKQDLAAEMETLLAAKIEMPILTSFELLTFDPKFFFDSDAHLTRAGGQMRTRRLCRKIQQWQDRYAKSNTQTQTR